MSSNSDKKTGAMEGAMMKVFKDNSLDAKAEGSDSQDSQSNSEAEDSETRESDTCTNSDDQLSDSEDSIPYNGLISSDSSSDESPYIINIDNQQEVDELDDMPYDKLCEMMTNLTSDGKVKKLIKRPGSGDKQVEKKLLSIYYTSYLESLETGIPTLSKTSKNAYKFKVDNDTIEGVKIAMASMKPYERSWFLIHPDLAFGKHGYPPRIGPDMALVIQIDLVQVKEASVVIDYNNLSAEDKQNFATVVQTVTGLIELAEVLFKGKVKNAVRQYSRALSLLFNFIALDIAEEKTINALLFKVYCNLVICNTKLSKPRRACKIFPMILKLSKNDPSLKIQTKVYFYYGRALLILKDFTNARKQLLFAQRLDPCSVDIANEITKLYEIESKDLSKEESFAETWSKGFKTIKDDDLVDQD